MKRCAITVLTLLILAVVPGCDKQGAAPTGGQRPAELTADRVKGWLADIDHLVATALLKAGAEIEAKTSKDTVTALIFAADLGHLAIVRLLVEKGANVKGTDKGGYSAIDYAAFPNEGDTQADGERTLTVMKYLKDKGAEPKEGTSGIIGGILAVGLQSDLKQLLEKAKSEAP